MNVLILVLERPTVGVTRKWAGVDKVWKREKLEARKMLEKRADSHLSGARCVGRFSWIRNHSYLSRGDMDIGLSSNSAQVYL